MRLLLTGAGGMLGRAVREAAATLEGEVVALERAELDITDGEAVARAVDAARPDVVINCAAYTAVDAAEGDEAAAEAVNGAGAGNVAAAACAAGAWTLHVSSDYVFDGSAREPYVESSAVAPVSAYGRTKLSGERAVAAAAPAAHTIVRSAWLFGTGGPCFPDTILRLAAERDVISVVEDQIGCPTYTGHLAGALVELAERRPAGVVHVAAAGQCSWYEFAREVVAGAGADCEVRPCTTEEFPRPAPRPAYSVLRSERGAPELPVWREGLREYLVARSAAVRA